MDTDVLVVGAGPTGLMLANQLARRGVRVLIIDRHAGPSRETRALGVQARTLEIYSALGIVDEALALGTPGNGAWLWANGRKMAHVPLGDAGKHVTPYPFILVLGQDDNERILGEHLKTLGVAVQWNTELVALEQSADGATAKLKSADGSTRTVTAAWIGGCDGAHSSVRELCGITFPGAPYEHVFFVADVEATGSMVAGSVNVYLWKDGFHLFFPMRGTDHWRIVGILPAALRDRGDVTFDSVLPAIRGELGNALTVKGCSWFSTYRIHHRCAARFRSGRCFLMGDAAHIHSPVGAQGMNTGLQDAYNLAWKLALVVQGRANAALLDSYEEERIRVAQRLLRTTDRGFRFIVADNRGAGLLRTQVLARMAAFALSRESVQSAAFRIVSQIGIRYRHSALSQAGPLAEGAPRAGDRFPWLNVRLRPNGSVEDLFATADDTRFNLYVFGQSAPGAEALPLGDLMRVHVVPRDPQNDAALARAGIPQPSFYLVRPDGYVGLCDTRFDAEEISRYLVERVHLSHSRDRTGNIPAEEVSHAARDRRPGDAV
ncbi:MAG TPA: FAD-dependent oxidoreductase [Steroidobacteraceae bacterium]|nr:FAD-dependent oxidoreductase [Steroidobacteraceae bacterium]